MVLNHVGSGAISGKEAAALLGLSERQLRRLRRAYEQEGAVDRRSWRPGVISAYRRWRDFCDGA
jgi:hypothetical protein